MKWRNIKLGRKLLVSLLACSLIPLCVMAYVSYRTANKNMTALGEYGRTALSQAAENQLEAMRDIKAEQVVKYFSERRGDLNVLTKTVGTLREEAFNKLTAVRQVKQAAVERYFQSIHDQILTFSEDKMVVEAMTQFKDAFRRYREQAAITPDELDERRAELREYYAVDFSKEYESQNGRSPEAEQYLDQLDEDSAALQYSYIRANENPLGSKHLLDRAADETEYSELHGRYHPVVRSYLEKFGYYDIFLVDPETGDIVYSVFKELDYSTSLIDGPYAGTNFGEVFRAANAASDKNEVVLVDYKRYTPSYEAPASFIASPIYDGDEKIGVAIFQMPIDRLNAIMNERAGLGETGETYLVGADHLMRSDSYLDPEGHSVTGSFRKPETGSVDTVAADAALRGETGAEIIIDYNGNPVLSAYCPVKVGGFTWALLAEIDVAEALCPKNAQGEYYFKDYAEAYGYYDLFLLNPNGFCFYTVAQEDDYQTNLVDGKYAETGLGRAVQQCLETKQFAFGDFEPYAPSNGAPAAFMAQPVVYNEAVELVVALQLSDKAINSMVGAGSSKEQNLEAYLVGSDGYMRSDSILNPDDYSITASFANDNKVSTDAVQSALNGETDTRVITDYLGSQVLSTWAPLDVHGAKWALICEIDEATAMGAVHEMASRSSETTATLVAWIGSLVAISGVLVTLISILIARSISKPLVQATSMIKDIAEGEGDLTKRLEDARGDELGDLARWFNLFVDKLRHIIGEIAGNAQSLAKSATELTSTATNLAGNAEETSRQSESASTSSEQMAENMNSMATVTEEMSSNVKTVAAAIEEMTASISEVAKNAEHAAHVAGQAVGFVQTSNDNISNLDTAADAIGKVIETIQDIAEQTNLLALNATIEAARAGDAGKGFAVVANEVKELANQTATATEDIRERIEGIQKSTGDAVGSIGQITEVINQINDVSRSIASAVEEQSITTREIAENVAQASTAAEKVSMNVFQSAESAQEITRNIAGVDHAAHESASGAARTQAAGGELSKLGEQLQTLVGQFKI